MQRKLLTQIRLERLMDLKIDYAFKQLFGAEKNKDITVVFLNAILQKSGRDRMKDISFKNVETGGEYAEDKQSRLDLLVLTEGNEWINIEMQFTNQYDMVKRSIYYWSGVYRRQLKSGMVYKELNSVISINIVNFNLFPQTDQFHTIHQLHEQEEKFRLTDVMEFHFIEMPKLLKDWRRKKLNPWDDVLARWLLMLGMIDHRNDKTYEDIYKQLEEIAMKDDVLFEAFRNWEELSLTDEQLIAYESRLKKIRDEEAAVIEAEMRVQEAREEARKEAFEEGRAEGRAVGKAEGKVEGKAEGEIEVARRFLASGFDLEMIIDITGLKKEEILDAKEES